MGRRSIETQIVNGIGRPSVLIIRFTANALSPDVFRELKEVISYAQNLSQKDIDDENRIQGIVFTSTKDKIFLAGADLYHLKTLIEPSSNLNERFLDIVIREGQDIFKRIEDLPVPTVAAIHGVCLGGGAELALACDYRVVSNHKDTKIGWPEVQLGILPAWGGCTRLPEVIGVPNALKAILTGKQYPAKLALKLKMVDKVVHRERLQQTAIDIIRSSKKVNKVRPHSLIPSTLIFRQARKNVIKKTSGNYPAPLKIIDVIEEGLNGFRNKSFELEREAFIELCDTKEMQNLFRIFFLQEKSKKLQVLDSVPSWPLSGTVVIGAGTMGAGIAQWISSRGKHVLLKDVKDEYISAGLNRIGKLYVQAVQGHKMDRPAARDGLARVSTTTNDVSLKNKQVVIEAIVEDLDIKRKVLSSVESQVSRRAIIATNTSALSIDELANNLNHPERFVGIHFFNPVHKMKLVEIVRGTKTSDSAVEHAIKYVHSIGKLPVVVKDSPGFVVNRILVPYLAAAAELLAQGEDMEAIDSAIVKFGMPMGPFRLMDEIGLDVCYHVASDLKRRLDRHYSLEELEWRVLSGRLGKKTGEGFYKYKNGRSIKKKSKKGAHILDLVDTMVQEAQMVLDEGVVDDPDMVDFAMIMGTGWAPFRGGPLKYRSLLTHSA